MSISGDVKPIWGLTLFHILKLYSTASNSFLSKRIQFQVHLEFLRFVMCTALSQRRRGNVFLSFIVDESLVTHADNLDCLDALSFKLRTYQRVCSRLRTSAPVHLSFGSLQMRTTNTKQHFLSFATSCLLLPSCSLLYTRSLRLFPIFCILTSIVFIPGTRAASSSIHTDSQVRQLLFAFS